MDEPLQRHRCVVYIGFTLLVWPFHSWLPSGLPYPLLLLPFHVSFWLLGFLVDVPFFMTKA